jgi:hypothetical protein
MSNVLDQSVERILLLDILPELWHALDIIQAWRVFIAAYI